MRFGQPDVERHEAGLGAEADQGQHEHHSRSTPAARRAWYVAKGVKFQACRACQAQQHEGEEQKRRPQMGRNQKHPAGVTHLRLFVLEGHEEVCSQRHDLPGHQEQDGGARDQHHHHAGDEEVEEEPRPAQRFLVTIGEQVVAAVDRRQSRQPQHRQQEERAEPQGIDLRRAERAMRCVPRQLQRIPRAAAPSRTPMAPGSIRARTPRPLPPRPPASPGAATSSTPERPRPPAPA